MLIDKKGPIDKRTEPQRVNDDIRDFFRENKISNKSVAEKLGISPAMFSYYFSGKTFLPKEIAKKLNQLYGFDDYYLTKGSFEITLDNKGEEFAIIHSLMPIEVIESAPIPEDPTKEDVLQMIENLQHKLVQMQKKCEIAEEALYSANRMLLSSSTTLDCISWYINNLNSKL